MNAQTALAELHSSRPNYWFFGKTITDIRPTTPTSARITIYDRRTHEEFAVSVYAN